MTYPNANSMLWFACIVDLGSFGQASERLGIPSSTLSRKLRELERNLGIRLLERTTRRMHLTEAGAVFYQHCVAMRREVEDAQLAVGQLQSTPSGVLKVASLYTFGSQYLAPLLGGFLQQYPDIRLQLTLNDTAVDLLAEGTDIALHVGPVEQGGYRFRKLGEAVMRLYASPRYLDRHGRPSHPDELVNHVTLAQSPNPERERVVWQLWQPEHEALRVQLRPALVSNEPLSALNTALGGHGIYFGTSLMARPHLAEGALEAVLPSWRGPTLEFHAVFPSRSGLPPKVRVFIDYLAEHIEESLA